MCRDFDRLSDQRRVARARCAEAEIALVSRGLNGPAKSLDTARSALDQVLLVKRNDLSHMDVACDTASRPSIHEPGVGRNAT